MQAEMSRDQRRFPGEFGSSNRKWISFWCLTRFPRARSLQRNQRFGSVDVDDRIELLWKATPEVMAHTLSFGKIDHTNCTLQVRTSQCLSQIGIPQRKHECRNARLVEQ